MSKIKDGLTTTNYNFPQQTNFYKGKVRDVYSIGSDYLVMIASDRISAFDHVLPRGIPFKGQVLNQVATMFLKATEHIVPNWLIDVPHPNVSVGYRCEPIRIEMVIRGYLTGHAWRVYKSGKRTLCGVDLPDGMQENEQFPSPIITPSTKPDEGHDEDASKEELLAMRLTNIETYKKLELITQQLFAKGTEMAAKRGLILVDTKYEFGMKDGEIMLMDEIHTPDSSRYFYADGYDQRQKNKEAQPQLSKEFVRQWLIENGFQGKEGQQIPKITDEYQKVVSQRYIELFERLTGDIFFKEESDDLIRNIEEKTVQSLKNNSLI